MKSFADCPPVMMPFSGDAADALALDEASPAISSIRSTFSTLSLRSLDFHPAYRNLSLGGWAFAHHSPSGVGAFYAITHRAARVRRSTRCDGLAKPSPLWFSRVLYLVLVFFVA